MKKLMHITFSFAIAWCCTAQQVLREFDWQKLAAGNELRGCEVVQLDGKPVLKISNTNGSPLQLQLLKINNPGVAKYLYALTGEIKYEGVHGIGYLEMWNFYLPLKPGMPEGQFFSRTLAEGGQLGRITGTCDWRSFQLPFDRTGTTNPPARLEFNVFLPARGTVFLSPVKLVEYEGQGIYAIKSKAGAWWAPRTAGVIGGLLGATLGIWGSIIGVLVSMGKGRAFAIATMKTWLVLGIASAIAGLSALITSQPYEVWFLLVLAATVLMGVSMRSLKDCKRRYEELELRKMASVDAR